MEPTTTHARPRIRRPRIRRCGLAVATAVIAPLVFAACGSSSASKRGSTSAPAKTAPAANAVQIKLIAYRPSKLSVAAGTTVTWNQMDPGVHTVTSGTVVQGAADVTEQPDGRFASGEIAKGKKFSHTFANPGTYKYFCEIHPATMTGEITVK